MKQVTNDKIATVADFLVKYPEITLNELVQEFNGSGIAYSTLATHHPHHRATIAALKRAGKLT